MHWGKYLKVIGIINSGNSPDCVWASLREGRKDRKGKSNCEYF